MGTNFQKSFAILIVFMLSVTATRANLDVPFSRLNFFPQGAYDTTPWSINGDDIVGRYQDGAGLHGFFYNGSSFTTVNDPNATRGTEVFASSGNLVVGQYFTNDPTTNLPISNGFTYNLATQTYTTLNNPLALGRGTVLMGVDGNNIVGEFVDPNHTGTAHGFLYNGGTYTTLDYPQSPNTTIAKAISGNLITGIYQDAMAVGGNGSHGFVYNLTNSSYTSIDNPNAWESLI